MRLCIRGEYAEEKKCIRIHVIKMCDLEENTEKDTNLSISGESPDQNQNSLDSKSSSIVRMRLYVSKPIAYKHEY
jgi:hypothetical protein